MKGGNQLGTYTGAQVLVKALKNEGVKHVFGISGHGSIQTSHQQTMRKLPKVLVAIPSH
jgi:thiamine pyrophosphate-dependent acetolactate synthase large subunit-like protein